MSAEATVRTLTSHKAWANQVLFSGLRAAPELERAGDFDLIRIIMDHALVVDLIFQAHLKGVAHGFTATRSAELRSLPEIAEHSREIDRWYVDYAEHAVEAALTRRQEIRFTDGKTVSMSPAEMILHVVSHGIYHRGNVGVLLHKNGVTPGREGLPEFLIQSASTVTESERLR